MNKTELTKRLAAKCDLSEARAAEVLDAIFGTEPGQGIIATELEAGKKVTIRGFGSFETKGRSARVGRNPATGGPIRIPARRNATFRPGKGLKHSLKDDAAPSGYSLDGNTSTDF